MSSPTTSSLLTSPPTIVPDFVWISPNQCHDMHGGVFVQVAPDGSDGTPCPFDTDDPNDAALKQKADAFRPATP